MNGEDTGGCFLGTLFFCEVVSYEPICVETISGSSLSGVKWEQLTICDDFRTLSRTFGTFWHQYVGIAKSELVHLYKIQME